MPQEAIGHLNVARLHLIVENLMKPKKNLERAFEICQLLLKFLRGEIFSLRHFTAIK